MGALMIRVGQQWSSLLGTLILMMVAVSCTSGSSAETAPSPESQQARFELPTDSARAVRLAIAEFQSFLRRDLAVDSLPESLTEFRVLRFDRDGSGVLIAIVPTAQVLGFEATVRVDSDWSVTLVEIHP